MGSQEIIFLIRITLIVSLIYLAYVDLRYFRLPDRITLPLVGLGIAFNSLSDLRFTEIRAALLGACLGYVFLWVLNLAYRILKGQYGIGMGDAKLLAGLGAWLGWSSLPSILLIASITALIGGTIWLKWGKNAFPFGPFLAVAGIIALLWPQFLPPILSISQI